MKSLLQARWITPLLVAALAIGLDQASKRWIIDTLGPTPMMRFIPLIGEDIRLAYSHNTGIAFSLFQGKSDILTVVAFVIMAGAIYLYVTQLPNRRKLVQVAMGLILGGALGNVIDRIRLGYVVDFIQVGWFPIFNLADSAITVGAVLLMLHYALDEIALRRLRQAMMSQ
ncbi:MAG: lipoprotein signal peptidase [Pirellulaceae bacterium]|uniref:signal peptidase II n=1 Tax=Chloroflexus sp. TaxID=1904827 RepID=UPI0021DB92CB|nr:signal peptidase II [Chloroflexus sp.]GIV88576.1 MAG: lipoprotein signal peptidase [Chloroflexus sp.]GIW91740.1 MAG: lipoprotein signal peptidase [Pirellulaceae bacterium]GIW91769.1 MAG: lipoprotein signal peptidase [Pirellulaceae bacterium]